MDDAWFQPMDPPDYKRHFERMDAQIPVIERTIWSLEWRDAFPPAPLLCSAWGGLGDSSRMGLHYLGPLTRDSGV